MDAKQQKTLEYAGILLNKLQEAFSEGELDLNELDEGDNLNSLFHALATVMPCTVFNQLTGNEYDYLEFNHLANRLTFQYQRKKPN